MWSIVHAFKGLVYAHHPISYWLMQFFISAVFLNEIFIKVENEKTKEARQTAKHEEAT